MAKPERRCGESVLIRDGHLRHQTVVGVDVHVESLGEERTERMIRRGLKRARVKVRGDRDLERNPMVADGPRERTESRDRRTIEIRVVHDVDSMADTLSTAERQRPPDRVHAVAFTCVKRQAESALTRCQARIEV